MPATPVLPNARLRASRNDHSRAQWEARMERAITGGCSHLARSIEPSQGCSPRSAAMPGRRRQRRLSTPTFAKSEEIKGDD